ncbi:MAG TPA: tRNA (guanosine(46)-N7)-methyltransferase TrmB [Firmicutes bacterium]|nr:tRNA (guanosine(46)-N7)-methyltransferase TrmB [Bacillota bacterium]
MRLKNKKWARPFIDEHPDLILNETSFLQAISSETRPIYLEVGSGKGQFLLMMGAKQPEAIFFGVERAIPAIAVAGKKLREQELHNVKFVDVDIESLLPSINDQSIAGIYLNFSDPWPKKHHEKRRLTHEKFLVQFMRILKVGALLKIKTDNDELFAFSQKNVEKLQYNIILSEYSYSTPASDDAMSEYEQNFRASNKMIHRLVIRKDK